MNKADAKKITVSQISEIFSRRGINFRLLKLIIGVSAVFTMFTTGIQLFVEYQRDIELQNQRIHALDESHIPALSLSIWEIDSTLTEVQLEGIWSLPDIYAIELEIPGDDVIRVGPDPANNNVITYEIELRHSDPDWHLGTLFLYAGMDIHIQRAQDRVLLILVTKGLQTFFVSFIILFIMEMVVTRHLGMISNYLSTLRIRHLDTPLILNRKKLKNHDEFDIMVNAFNEMRGVLKNDLGLIDEANREVDRSEKKFRNLYDTMVQGVIYQDEDGNIISANRAAEKIIGLPAAQMHDWASLGIRWQADEGREVLSEEVLSPMEILQTGREIENSLAGVFNTKRQEQRWLVVSSTPQFRNGGSTAHQTYSTFTDITKLKRAEDELRKLHRAVESSSVMVSITDINGVIEYCNPRFTEVTGYSSEEVIGKNMSILNSGEHPGSFYEDMWNTILSGNKWQGDIHNRKKDGTLYWDHSSISLVRDCGGRITNFIAIKDDVTSQHELTRQLSYQASHDALTGLINRGEFERRVTRLLTTMGMDRSSHALCFMDLDQFKIINDTCGHYAGDELLRQLGKLLQDVVRKRDTLARLGGDEFGVLMEHCKLSHARRVAEKLLQAIQDYQFIWEGEAYRIGISIGLVAITRETSNFIELFKQADLACYHAKEQGRNRIHVFKEENTELITRHKEMEWVGQINHAIDENRFCLYAQPIVSLENKDLKHFELLLRMRDGEGGIIAPGAFLPAAERYSLIEKVDAWVFSHACDLLMKHPAFVKNIDSIAINISGPSLSNVEFLGLIQRNLEQSGVSPGKICLEITETVAISNLSAAIHFISTMKKAGCRFSLDDFGSGLSSFGYLKNLQVDYLKIDGMFVKDIVDDPIDHAMVKSINEIAQVMELKTIAEFVENREIMNMLMDIGVDFCQGYYLGKPRLLEEILNEAL